VIKLDRLLILGAAVTHFLEEAPFHLFGREIGVDTGEHVAVKRPRTVPDVPKEEEQRKDRMGVGKPTAWARPEDPV